MRDLYLERESRLPVGLAAAAAAILLLLASASDVRAADPDMQPAATLAIEHGGKAFVANGPQHGTLLFRGRRHVFSVSGLGFGATGDADPGARGRVYNLRGVSYFPGDYTALKTAQARASGRLWLKNRDGVVLELEPASDLAAIALGPHDVTFSFR
jgi:hypothetical protein